MPPPTITSPKVTDGKTWEGHNIQGSTASFHTLGAKFVADHKPLPPGILSAVALFPRSQYSPPGNTGDVRWKVAKVVGTSTDDGQGNTTAGLALEGGLTDVTGGSTSGNTCSEHGLWESGKSFFNRKSAAYVIRVNLAPCLRCCGSLRDISATLGSPIVVIPDVDYEILASGRTPVTDRSYAFVFEPERAAFTVIHGTQTPRAFASNLGPRGEEKVACVACATPSQQVGAQPGQTVRCTKCKADKVLTQVGYFDGEPVW